MQSSDIPAQVDNLIGRRYGMLTVIGFGGVRNRHAFWVCKCDCGTTKNVRAGHLKTGNVKSCGCLRSIENKSRAKHKLSRSKIYSVYHGMIKRCCNTSHPSYKHYGGRGVKVCPEWKDKETGFENFYRWAMDNGYSEGLQIDRIDVNGDYKPSNCRFVSPKENSNNKTNNVPITINGVTRNLREWEQVSGIRYQTIQDRLRRGIQGEDLLKPTR